MFLMGLGLSFTRLNVMKMNGDDGSQHYQFSSVAQSCPTLQPHEPQHTSLPVHHQLPEPAQTHAH